LRDHSALNVTVEDCEGLVAALTDQTVTKRPAR
jgi:hypothetical protein